MRNKNSERLTCEKYEKFRKSKAVNILYDKGTLYFFLAFIIPFVLVLIAFHKQDIHLLWWVKGADGEAGRFEETGSQQMLVIDLWHQYFPFFRVVREKLLTGGSFLYSWQNGLGTNFLSLIAYYAASPLNWISVFFDDDHLREGMTYLTAAKIGLSGVFFSCFLRYTYRRKDISTVVFSVMFALCSYMMGYYWNVMWIDTVALFPLVMLGITAMCREGKWKLYTVTLALSVMANYYIGLFTCIFTVFMFASCAVIEWQGIKKFFVRIWLIIRSSAIGLGLGAFMLIPAYLALKLTHSADNTFPSEVSWAEKWTDIFANLISYREPTSVEGLPNFACGMLAVTLFGVFLFTAGIKIREKISVVLMLALIAVSCNMNQLNYIWHGFHVTNQIPYRYAFIFSFVLISAAYHAYAVMTERGIKIYQLIFLVAAPAAVFYMVYLSVKDSEDGFSWEEPAFRSSLIITSAYILSFVSVKLIPVKNLKIKRTLINIALAVAVVSEMSRSAVIGVGKVGSSDYNSYPTVNTEVQEMLDIVKNRDEKFSRTEMISTYTLNDSALYGYKGVSQFSSSCNVSVTRLMRRLGIYASEAGNRYYYRNSTPVVNGLTGIDFLISRVGAMKNGTPFLENIASSGSVYLYENKYPLSLGFVMNNDILNLPDENGLNPFEYQNSIMYMATGVQAVFTPQAVQLVSYDKMTADKKQYGEYNYNSDGSDVECSAEYSFAGTDSGYLYGYVRSDNISTADVTEDDTDVDSSIKVEGYPIVFPMGDGQGGTTKTIKLKFKKDRTAGTYTVMAYALNTQAFEEAYNKLADEQFNITEFADTKITGTVEALNDGVMYFSIPYEKGWTVYVDGEKSETEPVLNAMLGVNIGKGHHDIVLKYSPDGFSEGLAISGISVILFALFVIFDMYRKKKKSAGNVSAEVPETENPEIMENIENPEISGNNEINSEPEEKSQEKGDIGNAES
ncbi:MAG: YfhO family protein [Ruminococcus sp.]|nr:YfhO family protein [Ruminococcus sp.]